MSCPNRGDTRHFVSLRIDAIPAEIWMARLPWEYGWVRGQVFADRLGMPE